MRIERLLIPAIVLTLIVFLASVSLLAVRLGGTSPSSRGARTIERSPLEPDAVTEGLVIPDFSLVDQDGRTVSASLFNGQVTILDFFFTDCPAICPMMTGVMAELAQRLRETPVRLVSVSVNPERDTPPRLRRYAEAYGADLSRWTFLTGDYEVVRRIAHDALAFEVRRDPARMLRLDDGGTTWNVVHPGKLLLVGPDRRVLGMYEYSLEHEVEALARRARLACTAMRR